MALELAFRLIRAAADGTVAVGVEKMARLPEAAWHWPLAHNSLRLLFQTVVGGVGSMAARLISNRKGIDGILRTLQPPATIF